MLQLDKIDKIFRNSGDKGMSQEREDIKKRAKKARRKALNFIKGTALYGGLVVGAFFSTSFIPVKTPEAPKAKAPDAKEINLGKLSSLTFAADINEEYKDQAQDFLKKGFHIGGFFEEKKIREENNYYLAEGKIAEGGSIQSVLKNHSDIAKGMAEIFPKYLLENAAEFKINLEGAQGVQIPLAQKNPITSATIVDKNGDEMTLYRFEHPDGKVGYYDMKGNSYKDIDADFDMPMKGGRITSEYGWRIHPVHHTPKFHFGADIVATDPALLSMCDGIISKVIVESKNNKNNKNNKNKDGSGNTVEITYTNGSKSTYRHCQDWGGENKKPKVGGRVKKGQQVGIMGDTGVGTGPHLHVEFRIPEGILVNPIMKLKDGSIVVAKYYVADTLNKKQVLAMHSQHGMGDGKGAYYAQIDLKKISKNNGSSKS